MQAAGSLKKKRKRNLAKVSGLSTQKYNDQEDLFDLNAMYSDSRLDDPNVPLYSNVGGDEGHLRIQISRLAAQQLDMGEYYNRKNSRATRDPRFSQSFDKEESKENWTRPQTAASSGGHEYHHNRPALLSPNHFARLGNIMLLGITSFSFPWRWNKETYQMEKWSPFWCRIWFLIWSLLAIQSTLITGFQFYSFFARMHLDEDGSYRPVFMNSFSVLWYTYAIAVNICMFFYRDKIRNYINCLFTLNKKLVDEFLISTEGHKEGGQILLNISIPTNITQTFISISLFLTFPFSPWYLYSYIYTPENPWYWLIPGALQEFLLIGQILACYLLIGFLVVAHGNSVEFWLQEAHNHNDTGMTRDELRQSHKAIEVYRALQVLTNIFNDALAPMAIPVVKIINWSALIPCGYVLIRSMNNKFIDEFPGILTYPFGVIDCVTSSYGLLQISAEMFDIASGFLNSWSQTKNKTLRRILVSCPVLKVKIGSLYSVTVSTTVTYFKSCFDYIVDCIITFK